MQARWEYYMTNIPHNFNSIGKMLNGMGEEEWELTTIVHIPDLKSTPTPKETDHYAIFKRASKTAA